MRRTSIEPEARVIATPKNISGRSVRTSNSREQDPATAALPKLWGEFLAANDSSHHPPSAAARPVYSVYTEYESDMNGAYTVVLGWETPVSPGPSERTVTLPAGRYLVFTSVGEMPAAVLAGWAEVWSFFESADAPVRAYVADFEYYDPATPSTVRIHIGVKVEQD